MTAVGIFRCVSENIRDQPIGLQKIHALPHSPDLPDRYRVVALSSSHSHLGFPSEDMVANCPLLLCHYNRSRDEWVAAH